MGVENHKEKKVGDSGRGEGREGEEIGAMTGDRVNRKENSAGWEEGCLDRGVC